MILADPFSFLSQHARLLLRTSYVELKKRYSGSFIGGAWIVLYPLLFLSMYVFVFQMVFKVRITGVDAGPWQYVLFVFSALVPMLGLTECMTTGCTVLKQNMHFIKNLIIPMEIMPLRAAVMASMTMCVSLVIVLALSLGNGSLGLNVLWLPFVLVAQFMFMAGLALILSVFGILIPDVAYIINVFCLMLTFVSPIGFTREMVPPALQGVLYLNPVYYMAELYRSCLMFDRPPPALESCVFVAWALLQFFAGWYFFGKFKGTVVDYE